MKAFPDKLIFEDVGMVGGSRVFGLMTRYRYLSSRGEIVVPAGFRTDGASVPRIFWNIFSPIGEYFGAAVVHDFLYSGGRPDFTRPECDLIFKEAMFNAGVGWVSRELIYRSVRLGGWRFFKGKK